MVSDRNQMGFQKNHLPLSRMQIELLLNYRKLHKLLIKISKICQKKAIHISPNLALADIVYEALTRHKKTPNISVWSFITFLSPYLTEKR